MSQDCLPPSSTLIDFQLIRDLKLKLTNIQCQKFTYAGYKMRIVGAISTPVQFVRDGCPVGKFMFSATVVRGLSNSLDTDIGTKLCKQLLKAAVVKLPQAGGDASVQTQLGDGDSEVITSPASGGSSVMPPSAEGSPSTPPALGGHVHARPDEVGGPNDVRPEGVGGPNDVQPEGVGGSDEVCPGVGAMSTTTPPTGPTSTTMPPTGPTSTLTPSTGLTSTVSQPSLAAHVRNVAALENLSPVVVNAKVLYLTFGRADLQPDPDIEMDTLLAHSVQTKARGTIHREPH